ncbi:MAG TPA: biotin--[acetyl-CoA-carboxylase] ligase [Candidatus Binatia bacterium]|nr:biotin--[acetyl-CoA-carboxylase] ligase [Candidatus Binatia bacterium]
MTDHTVEPGSVASPYSRLERFAVIGSTNDVVRAWLAEGAPEICVAAADEQTAGRGRAGRRWIAPPGAALLVSLGFRPTWLPADRAWRIPAVASLAMADAAEDVAGLPERTIKLKWPNDLVVVTKGPDALLVGEVDATAARERLTAPLEYRKLGGVLGETEGLGSADPRLVVGIGVNADWPATAFPPDLAATMTSLREASGGRPIDRGALLDAFLDRLAVRVEALRGGWFPVDDWMTRQLTTGRLVDLETDAGLVETALAVGLDPQTGALLVRDPARPDAAERAVHVGEVRHVRLALARGAGERLRPPEGV